MNKIIITMPLLILAILVPIGVSSQFEEKQNNVNLTQEEQLKADMARAHVILEKLGGYDDFLAFMHSDTDDPLKDEIHAMNQRMANLGIMTLEESNNPEKQAQFYRDHPEIIKDDHPEMASDCNIAITSNCDPETITADDMYAAYDLWFPDSDVSDEIKLKVMDHFLNSEPIPMPVCENQEELGRIAANLTLSIQAETDPQLREAKQRELDLMIIPMLRAGLVNAEKYEQNPELWRELLDEFSCTTEGI